MKYVDMVRAEIDRYEKEGYPTGTETGVDVLDIAIGEAQLVLESLNSQKNICDKDKKAYRQLHAQLCNLREALEGGDVRHAARAGVAFGKALQSNLNHE